MSLLHGLELPDLTRDCLTDLVLLQISLLSYASITPPIVLEEGKVDSCARYLDEHGFSDRSMSIALWFFDVRAKKRKNLLAQFANVYQLTNKDKMTQQARKDWIERIRKEVEVLHDENTPVLTVSNFFEDGKEIIAPSKKSKKKHAEEAAITYQQVAARFFLYFYTDYIGTDEKLPACIFTHFNDRPFGRQEILEAFIMENEGLEICAVCDQTRYYTRGQQQTYSILDHYFPKETYPHFSCHPYNLIPVCYTCNSSVKGVQDPLLGENKEHRPLLKKSLPYRHHLSEHVYLEVRPGKQATLFEIEELKPRSDTEGEIDAEIQEAIDLLHCVYQLPDRWRYADQTIKICDTLFRRIRHFLDGGRNISYGTNRPDEIYNALKQLLYYLDAEDQRHDPFAFAMTWILVALLKSKGTATWAGLIEEINSWSGTGLDLSNQRDSRVEALLEVFRVF